MNRARARSTRSLKSSRAGQFSIAWVDKQAQQSLTAWQKAADELCATKDRLGIVTIEGRRRNLETQIADIDSKSLANESELKTSRAKIGSLEGLIGGLSQTIVT